MAGEISNLTISGLFQPSTLSAAEKFGNTGKAEDVTDKNFAKNTATIGTTDETLALGDVAVPKRLWCENNGAFPVRFRSGGSGNYDVECAPGSMIYVGWNGAAIHAIAIGGNSDIRFFIGGV